MPYFQTIDNNIIQLDDPSTAPAGAVAISDEQATNAMAFKDQQVICLSTLRVTRELTLNRLTGYGFIALQQNDTATLAAIQTIRIALLNATQDPRIISATDIPSLKAAVISSYVDIVAVSPDNLKKAFDQTFSL